MVVGGVVFEVGVVVGVVVGVGWWLGWGWWLGTHVVKEMNCTLLFSASPVTSANMARIIFAAVNKSDTVT
jgi:predicted negative regulator of RcsB-dependent stress response